MAMSNSSLVTYTRLSPNNSGQRVHAIDRITPHCIVGQWTAKQAADFFADSSREASCNYAIGKDGSIALVVEENKRSWCSSSNSNDQRAVTIECASDTTHPYVFTATCYNTLVKLCVDICKRNGKTKLLWLGDKTKTLNYSPKAGEMVLTVHRWFANKACPGDWLMGRLSDLAATVTKQLQNTPQPATGTLYKVQVGAYKNIGNAERMKARVNNAGFDTFMVQEGGLHKVQVGAFSQKANAEKQRQALRAKGFAAIIKTYGGTTPTPAPAIKVGSTVRLKSGAKTYDGVSLADFVYKRSHIVSELSGDRAVIIYGGTVVAAVKVSDLTLVK